MSGGPGDAQDDRRGRFTKSVELYRAYLADPAHFRFSRRVR